MNNDEKPPVDWLNVAYILGSIGVVASFGWPAAVILWPLYYGQQALRNTPAIREWGQNLLTTTKGKVPLLTDGKPKTVVPYSKPNTVISTSYKLPQEPMRQVDPYAHLPLWERVTRPVDSTQGILVPKPNKGRGKVSIEDQQIGYLERALRRLPEYVHYSQLPPQVPSRLSVPIGINAETNEILYGDFDADSDGARILHALVAGQTGAGKDALLRLWFTTLTLNNTPQQIQFVLLDGKNDWMSEELASSVYMAVPPAGGMQMRKVDGKRINCAKEKMAESLDWVFDELERRAEKMRKVGGVLNLNAYNAKMRARGEPELPMLFLIASDVGKSFDGELGTLVELLILKGRAFGVRMIISMQDPVGEGTGWRGQIGLVLSGFQQDPLHDNRIMGQNVGRMLVRPSQLPDPETDDLGKGLFVMRQGNRYYLIRTPHLPEDDWFEYIGSNRFHKRWYNQDQQNEMLAQMLELDQEPKATRRFEPIAPPQIITPRDVNNPKNVLSHDQIMRIVQLAKQNVSKSDIMTDLGFTNSTTWDKKVGAVEAVIIAARGRLRV
jgi:hypothetical protein